MKHMAKMKSVKIISKSHTLCHINQKIGQASKKPKRGHITRATSNNTKHIKHKTRKRVMKTGTF